jgi:hypothetical protein
MLDLLEQKSQFCYTAITIAALTCITSKQIHTIVLEWLWTIGKRAHTHTHTHTLFCERKLLERIREREQIFINAPSG